jgi:bifunctional pyridoxal-dependent enzyme with beta-cystathionase and maltose regulon repressor activities
MSIKYDYAAKLGVPEMLAMWVADMDFRSPACVNEALAERSRHGLYGDSDASEAITKPSETGFFRVTAGKSTFVTLLRHPAWSLRSIRS